MARTIIGPRWPWVISGLLLALLGSGCAVNPVSGKNNFVMMSEDAEIKMGRDAHPEIVRQYGGAYDNPELQAYVEDVGKKLAASSHRNNLEFHFTVLDSPVVNAFALPGGYIYMTRGLLAYLNSEAELAAVLGHEIGHVTARHSVRQVSAAKAAEIGYNIGSILVPELRTQAAQSLFNVLGTVMISGYGREHELESDRLGAEYLAKSGYDPNAMIEVIGVLKDQESFAKQLAEEEGREPQGYHGLFASHPKNDRRLQEVVASAERWKSDQASYNDREGFLQRLDGLVFGDSEKAGIVRKNTFYHKDLGVTLQFPPGWKVDNLPDRLIARPRDGEVLIQVQVEDIKAEATPVDFMKTRLKLRNIRDGEESQPDGREAYTGTVKIDTPFGKRQTRVSVVFYNEHAYIFMGATKEANNLDQYDHYILDTMMSFHTLTTDEERLAKALKLDIIKAAGGDNFLDYSKSSMITSHAEEQLRLLNDYYPDGEPVTGQMIKLVK